MKTRKRSRLWRIGAFLLGWVIAMTGSVGTIPAAKAAEAFRLSSAFGSGMVLQQKQDIRVFGFGSAGDTVTVTLKKAGGAALDATGKIAADGTWSVTLPAQTASFDGYTLTATNGRVTKTLTDILIGEVWATGGQSNMKLTVKESAEGDAWKRKKRNANIRLYVQSNYSTLYDPLREPSGTWHSASDWTIVEQYSAVAYYFAETLYRELQVPIGLIDSSVGGTPIWTWISRETMDGSPEMKKWLSDNGMYQSKEEWAVVDGRFTYAKYRGGLFNSRVAPLTGLRAAGILWYQGEDQVPDPTPLTLGIPLLVKDFSRVFGDGEHLLPFISIQLAPYAYYDKGSLPLTNELMNEAVKAVNKISGKAISVPIYDVSLYSKPDNHPIHPATKQPVGERCALTAAGMAYGLSDTYSGPVPVSATASGRTVTVTFDCVGKGLTAIDGAELSGFKLVKANGNAQSVSARIASKNTVVIETDTDAVYTGVQYAFAAMNNTANLGNRDGFPALPFRIGVKQGANTTAGGKNTTGGSRTTARTSGSAAGTSDGAASAAGTTADSAESSFAADSAADPPADRSDGGDATTAAAANINTESRPQEEKAGSVLPWILGGLGGLAVIGAGVFLILRRKKRT